MIAWMYRLSVSHFADRDVEEEEGAGGGEGEQPRE
jgi:hypothetical protein